MKIDNQLMKDKQQHGVFVANKPGTDNFFMCIGNCTLRHRAKIFLITPKI